MCTTIHIERYPNRARPSGLPVCLPLRYQRGLCVTQDVEAVTCLECIEALAKEVEKALDLCEHGRILVDCPNLICQLLAYP